MKKIDLRPIQRSRVLRLLILAFVTILLIVLLFWLFTKQTNKPTTLAMIEDGALRTGPQAFYPIIFDVKKGDHFDIIKHTGKWYYVDNGEKKGWIAGWHTNLNIKKDKIAGTNPFKDKVIMIDPGHGGNDQGASSKDGTIEKVITLKTSLMLKQKLEEEGATVLMTRNSDEYIKLKNRKGAADVFISIHADALEASSPHGLTVYYHHDNQKVLADTLHMAIKQKALLSDRGVRQENFQVIRQTKTPAVLLELGYISNPTDEKLMNDKVYRQIITTSIVDGLRNYFLY
ncbi:N-acetylmuramoyl-L-alanine amidase [Macrococcoides goetzii]|uniref:N-acetylmuramoyl-L-alanine amidase n=1 Tax=Macrococcus TaxID=69965 RepID=UPI001EF207B4|nr:MULTISPECIES: N-acetylmuramoyl-L-alanine amidase [Macrococcus]MCG7420161.1 N-acetylmuramoyl-L-alanine amidase [Macrococcus epidermidis]MCH4984125.1 N-acetylmuramoyl-L-alanine amidase [Macrococcus sp. PK]